MTGVEPPGKTEAARSESAGERSAMPPPSSPSFGLATGESNESAAISAPSEEEEVEEEEWRGWLTC